MWLLTMLACSGSADIIEGNIRPSAVLLVPLNDSDLADAQELVFTALIADDRDPAEVMGVTWSWAGDPMEGEAGLSGDMATMTVESPGLGEHEVWIEVVDVNGATGGDKATFTLRVPEDADLDGDGYIDVALGGADCDDTDPDIAPGTIELCDGIDQDCDGEVDEDLLTTWYLDQDGDGFGDPVWSVQSCERPANSAVENDTDCDDTDAGVYPGAPERCDGVDQDCDGTIDEDDAAGGWYADQDQDGWGDAQQPLASCEPTVGGALDDTDCDDLDADQRWCLSCADLSARDLVVEGLNSLSTSTGASYETLCDDDWTLVATNTRTGPWDPAAVLDDATFGSPSESEDFKSQAWSSAPFTDVRFVNDGEYARYDDVGDGTQPWHAFQIAVPGANCGPDTEWHWEMTEGTMSGHYLCSTDLYVNPSAYNATGCPEGAPGFGPTWSIWTPGFPCPLNLPHASGFQNDDLNQNPFGADEGPLRMWVR
jgi:hypothetical protein